MGRLSKSERERREKNARDLELAMKEQGLWREPKCKCCKKTPEKITEYAHFENPSLFVVQNERFTPDGYFYCTTCYVKCGMPHF